MKKDILFLCQFFYPETVSSATLPYDTAEFFALKDYSVGAMCGFPKEYTNKNNYPKKETVNGIDIKRIRYIQLKRSNFLGRFINYFSFTLSALLHIGHLRKYKCVIVYTNPPILSFVAGIANKLFKTKFIFVAYDIYPEIAYATNTTKPGSFISKCMNFINKLIYKNTSCVVALTEEMKDYLLKNRSQLDENRIAVIPNWAHEKFVENKSADSYKRFSYKENQFVVSYFGNMGTCQDVDTMMQAAISLKDNDNIKFLIAGHGNKKDAVEQIIRDNKLNNIQLYDFLSGEDLNAALSISSCCIVSLEKGLMGTCAPSKYYSYLQAGCPVIAIVDKDSYLWKEINENNNGVAVETGDYNSLKKALLYMQSNESKVKKMSESSKNIYTNYYDYSVAMEKYQDVIERINLEEE